jgi:hypothetical protein
VWFVTVMTVRDVVDVNLFITAEGMLNEVLRHSYNPSSLPNPDTDSIPNTTANTIPNPTLTSYGTSERRLATAQSTMQVFKKWTSLL